MFCTFLKVFYVYNLLLPQNRHSEIFGILENISTISIYLLSPNLPCAIIFHGLYTIDKLLHRFKPDIQNFAPHVLSESYDKFFSYIFSSSMLVLLLT